MEPGGVTRGASWSGHERNHYWKNMEGKDFLEMSGISHADVSWDSRSFSLFDFDHDGFQDFVMVNANRPFVQLFRNRFGELLPDGKRGGAIYLRLEGGNHGPDPDPDWSNRDGIGARVLVDLGDRTLLREYRCGEGLGAQNSATLHIGIGQAEQVQGLRILWPSGRETEIPAVPAGRLVTVRERSEDPAYTVESRKPLATRGLVAAIDPGLGIGHSPELDGLPFRVDHLAACRLAAFEDQVEDEVSLHLIHILSIYLQVGETLGLGHDLVAPTADPGEGVAAVLRGLGRDLVEVSPHGAVGFFDRDIGSADGLPRCIADNPHDLVGRCQRDLTKVDGFPLAQGLHVARATEPMGPLNLQAQAHIRRHFGIQAAVCLCLQGVLGMPRLGIDARNFFRGVIQVDRDRGPGHSIALAIDQLQAQLGGRA